MSNPLFDALGGRRQTPPIMQQFQQFMSQMQGKNPQEEINKLLQSGRISQQQLNQAQMAANQMAQMFKGFN